MKIHYTGRYQEIVGKKEEIIELPAEKVEEVIVELIFKYPGLKKDRARMMVFRRGINLQHDDLVSQEDDLVIAPPLVSGG